MGMSAAMMDSRPLALSLRAPRPRFPLPLRLRRCTCGLRTFVNFFVLSLSFQSSLLNPSSLALRKVPGPGTVAVTPAMQAALRTDQAKAAREEMEDNKKGKKKKGKIAKSKSKTFRRKGSKLRKLRARSRLSSAPASSNGDCLWLEHDESEPVADPDPDDDGQDDDLKEEKKKPGRKPGPAAKAKAKAKAPKATAKSKAKALPKAKAKAKAKAKGKAGPKAKAKSKAKASKKTLAAKPDTKKGIKRARAEAADPDAAAKKAHPKQRRVKLGRGWIFEILPDQELGCSNCRYIYNGCTACIRENFRGKTAAQMREDDDYWWAASWLDEKGMEGDAADEA